MAETTGSGFNESVVSGEPVPGQLLVRDFATGLLANFHVRPGPGFSLIELTGSPAGPHGIRDQLLASSLGDMMVRDGELLTPNPVTYEDYDLPVVIPGVDATLIDIAHGATVRQTPKRRFITAAEAKQLGDMGPGVIVADFGDTTVVDYRGEYDWKGVAGVIFWYDTPGGRIGERLCVTADHAQPSDMPTFDSQVVLPGKLNPGTRQPNWERLSRAASGVEEIAAFLGIMRTLHQA